jgi:hypothetical protein
VTVCACVMNEDIEASVNTVLPLMPLLSCVKCGAFERIAVTVSCEGLQGTLSTLLVAQSVSC